jgi:hypothetical protein
VADSAASGGQYVTTSSQGGGTLRFYGRALDLVFRRPPGGGRVFVTLDGKAVGILPRDETGASFVEQANGQSEWRVSVPVARNLAGSTHTLEFHTEGEVNLDGFIVPAIQPIQPPWWLIGGLGALGLGAWVLAWNQGRSSAQKHTGAV